MPFLDNLFPVVVLIIEGVGFLEIDLQGRGDPGLDAHDLTVAVASKGVRERQQLGGLVVSEGDELDYLMSVVVENLLDQVNVLSGLLLPSDRQDVAQAFGLLFARVH